MRTLVGGASRGCGVDMMQDCGEEFGLTLCYVEVDLASNEEVIEYICAVLQTPLSYHPTIAPPHSIRHSHHAPVHIGKVSKTTTTTTTTTF